MTKIEKWYFTYGSNHEFGINGYTEMIGFTEAEAWGLQNLLHGRKWAFQYTEKQMLPILAEYPLHWSERITKETTVLL